MWDKIKDWAKGVGDAVESSYKLLIHKPGRWLAGNAGFVASFFVAGGNPILMGAISGAWSGGYYAEQADGDIWKGALFGAGVGAVTGYLGDKVSNFVKSGLGPSGTAFAATQTPTLENLIKGSLITGAEFGIANAGRGMIAGYAGGKGSTSDVLQSGLRGFYQGAAFGGIVGGTYATGVQKIFHGNTLNVTGTPSYSPSYNGHILHFNVGKSLKKIALAIMYIIDLLTPNKPPTPPDKIIYDRKPRKPKTSITRTTNYNPEANLKNLLNTYGL